MKLTPGVASSVAFPRRELFSGSHVWAQRQKGVATRFPSFAAEIAQRQTLREQLNTAQADSWLRLLFKTTRGA